MDFIDPEETEKLLDIVELDRSILVVAAEIADPATGKRWVISTA